MHMYCFTFACSLRHNLWFMTFWRKLNLKIVFWFLIWTASSKFGTYRLCEQRRFRRACASAQSAQSAQSRQNLHCSLIQAVNQEEPSDRKPDPWPLWMAGHAQLKFVMTECSKTQIHRRGSYAVMRADIFSGIKFLSFYICSTLSRFITDQMVQSRNTVLSKITVAASIACVINYEMSIQL